MCAREHCDDLRSHLQQKEEIGKIVGLTSNFFIVASSQFFSERKMRKPPAMLVVAEASSFHLFFLV